MFPPHDANIIRNEAGEPIGWDYPSECEPEYDDNPYDPDPCGEPFKPSPKDDSYCVRCGLGPDYHDDDEEDDAGEPPELDQEQTWPDLDEECEKHLKAAFAVLGRAPGYRLTYERAQQAIAHAVRILRGLPE